MKLKSILLLSTLTACLSASAQIWVSDSVTMGAGYANDIYYSFGTTGAVSAVANNTWDLAFQMTPQGAYGSVSVLSNSTRGGDSVYSLHMQASTKFTTLTAADTVGKTGAAMTLFNADSTWNLGAFNKMNNPANAFDFSWGIYNLSDHSVNGDSLYLVKTGGNAYKVWVQKYISTPVDSIKWIFRVAKFDGTGDTTVQLARSAGFANRLFAYFNLGSKASINREPASTSWDVVFTRYSEITAVGPGVSIPYPVTGVLSNYSTTVARAQHVLADAAVMSNYTFSAKLNTIGSVWKSFNQSTNQYAIADSNSYFVKSQNSNTYYQLQFTGFTSSTGGISFKKRAIGATSVSTAVKAYINAFAIAPNPANNTASVMIDAKIATANTRIVISDVSGKVVKTYTVNVNAGMNAYTVNTADFSSGLYMVNVSGSNWATAGKMMVQH